MSILLMNRFLNYLKYSGLWLGIVFNPFHWQLGWVRDDNMIMSNTVLLGPIWVTLIIDCGDW